MVTKAQPRDKQSGSAERGIGDDGARNGADGARPAGRRGLLKLGPILPPRLRPVSRPTMWIEIALIGVGYYFYRVTQNAAGGGRTAPYHRGRDVLKLEHLLHIDIEHWLNHTMAKIDWLIVGMNYYYATLHFIVTIAVFAWVYVKFPDRYRAIRTVMFAMNGVALLGFYFYAVAPPRLLDPNRFNDTFCVHHTWGKTTCSGVAGLSGSVTNEFAAMPSLHIGWAVWCGLAIAHLAKRKWVKILGILYPVATFTVIISTAQHYVLDVIGGLVVLAAGFLVQRVLQGRPVYSPLPVDSPLPAAGPARVRAAEPEPEPSVVKPRGVPRGE